MFQLSIKQYRPLFKALLTPFIFELCGIIPLILVTIGLVSISAGVTLRNALVNQYFYIFYFFAAAFFGYSIYLYLKEKSSCNISGLKSSQKIITITFVVLTAFESMLLYIIQLLEKYLYGQSQTNMKDFLGVAIVWWGIFALFLLFLRVSGRKNGRS